MSLFCDGSLSPTGQSSRTGMVQYWTLSRLSPNPLDSLLVSKYLSLLPASKGFAPQDHSLASSWRIVPAWMEPLCPQVERVRSVKALYQPTETRVGKPNFLASSKGQLWGVGQSSWAPLQDWVTSRTLPDVTYLLGILVRNKPSP